MEYKCPNCGGPLKYDIESEMMKCDFCGLSIFKELLKTDIPQTSEFSKENEDTADTSYDPMYMEMKIYHCSSCGADLMVGQTQTSTFCSYCGSPSIVYERISKEERPKKIIPFKLSESQALACIKDRFGHGHYIPPQIRKLTPEKVHAIYIPYWLYTIYTRKNVKIKVGSAENKNTFYRDFSCVYHNIPMDASLKLSNELSQRLNPYYMNELTDFDPAYLSGFYADKYDVPSDAFKSDLQKLGHTYITKEIMRTVPQANYYKTSNGKVANFREIDPTEKCMIQDVSYAMLPAYFVNVPYQKGRELIIVNGQTGKVVGNLPIEREQFLFNLVKNMVISCLIFCLLSVLLITSKARWIIFILPVMFTVISFINGLKAYKKYKLGRFKLQSQRMNAYVSRTEE